MKKGPKGLQADDVNVVCFGFSRATALIRGGSAFLFVRLPSSAVDPWRAGAADSCKAPSAILRVARVPTVSRSGAPLRGFPLAQGLRSRRN